MFVNAHKCAVCVPSLLCSHHVMPPQADARGRPPRCLVTLAAPSPPIPLLCLHCLCTCHTALLQPVYREHRKRGWGQGARGPLLRIPYSFPLDRSPTRPPRFLVGTSACVRVLCVSMCVCISLRCFRRGMPLQAPRATLTHSFTHSAHVPPCQSLGETDLHLHQTTQRPLR